MCVTCSHIGSLPARVHALSLCQLKHFTVHLCVAVLAAKNFVCPGRGVGKSGRASKEQQGGRLREW